MLIASVVSEWTRPVPCVCVELVIPFHWPPCSPVVIHPLREDVDLCTPLSLLPSVASVVLSSPDLVRLTEDPLSARSSPTPTHRHPDTRSLIPHLKLLPSGFNKGYSSLAVNGKHILCLVRGCLDDCDLFGWLCWACGVARILLPVLLARTIEQAGLMHYSTRPLDTRRRARVVTVPMSGACTCPKWCETGTTWISASGIGYPGVTCVDGFPSQARDMERYG